MEKAACARIELENEDHFFTVHLIKFLLSSVILVLALFGWREFYMNLARENVAIASTAEQLKVLSLAVQNYVRTNHVVIESGASPGQSVTITVPMLRATNLIPISFSLNNPYNQTWQAQVLQVSPGQLQVVLMSYGGAEISEDSLIQIVSMAGVPGGGFVTSGGQCVSTNKFCMMGWMGNGEAMNKWQAPLDNYTSPGLGHAGALMYFNRGMPANNFLYRNAMFGN